jgi:hypothetical protein
MRFRRYGRAGALAAIMLSLCLVLAGCPGDVDDGGCCGGGPPPGAPSPSPVIPAIPTPSCNLNCMMRPSPSHGQLFPGQG